MKRWLKIGFWVAVGVLAIVGKLALVPAKTQAAAPIAKTGLSSVPALRPLIPAAASLRVHMTPIATGSHAPASITDVTHLSDWAEQVRRSPGSGMRGLFAQTDLTASAAEIATQSHSGVFDADGNLTEKGQQDRCPAALSDLNMAEQQAMTAASTPEGMCGVGETQLAQWADVAYQRGCLSDADWAGVYQRLHVRHLAATDPVTHAAFRALPGSLPALGNPPSGTCSQDAWADAELTNQRMCEALLRKDGQPVLDAAAVCAQTPGASFTADVLLADDPPALSSP